uniref:Major facilitator superfamily domain containing 10 n=1 Tax=Erpetoichthys calabaricus TaxID=27687 RepID=A0A8C4XB71_ERPCA
YSWGGGVGCLPGYRPKPIGQADDGSSRVITVVFLALLIDLLGFTLILPLLPSIMDYYGRTDDGIYRTLQNTVDWFSEKVGVPEERKYNSVLFGGTVVYGHFLFHWGINMR